MTQRCALLALALSMTLLGAGCRSRGGGDESGHDHDHASHAHGDGGHDHGDGHAGDEPADERPTMALTLFAPTHELFVELDVPVAGQPGSFHAHVTRLADNAPATSGTFTVEFRDAMGDVASTFSVPNVARSGIFTPEGPGPAQPGGYRLLFRYEAPPHRAEWDGGTVDVGREPIEPPAPPEGDITFLKETAWKIPFRVERPARMPVARRVIVAARVEADPLRTTLLAWPAAGVVTWEPTAAVAGTVVRPGDLVARLLPAASFGTSSELTRARAEADAELARARADVERVDALARDGLASERRRDEVKAALANAEAAASQVAREEGLHSGRGRGVEVRAPAGGLLAEIVAPSGTRVGAGELLARIASDDAVLVRGILRGVDAEIAGPGSMAIRGRGWAAPEPLEGLGGEPLPVARAADPAARGFLVGARVTNASGRLRIGDAVELHVAVGDAAERLTLPVGAIVEVNTQPSAFVMVSGESFERRRLVLGPSDGQRVAVLEGLDESDWVVSVGGFDVHVASLAGTVESHRH